MSLVAITLPILLIFVLNNSRVQNMVMKRVTVVLSQTLGNHVSVGDMSMSWFNNITMSDLLVTCNNGDTVLSAPELICRLNILAVASRNIDIRRIVLNNADIRLANDPETDEVNIKFIINRFKSEEKTSSKWDFGIRSIELNNCRFSYKNPLKTFDKPFGMDYADIDVSRMNMLLSDFQLAGDSLGGGVRFRIRNLSGVEKCGLELISMTSDFIVNNNNLSFSNLTFKTSVSSMHATGISFRFDSLKDYSDGSYISKVVKNVEILSSDIAFEDISHFVPYFDNYSGIVNLAGTISGTVESLNGENLDLIFGEMTRINGNFDLRGLPNLRTTLIYVDISEMITCPKDIELVQIARLPGGHVTIPENMHQLETIEFKGNFTGFFDDFVTFGTLSTNLGNFSTDLSIRPLKDSDIDTTFTFRGRMRTEHFNLGKLLMQPAIGIMTMSGEVEGSASVQGRIQALLEGNIRSVDLGGYQYRDITVNGAVNNRVYDGHLSIDEPNIKVDFSGKVDMTESIPAFDFFADVERAKLYNLKLVEKDTSSFAAFKIKAEFSGTNIDNLSGDLELKNSLIRRNSREIEINDLIIFTKEIRDTNQFILRSDIFDAEIRGQYQFLKLPESFFSMVKNFAPAWAPTYANPDSLSLNNFRFDAKFKDTQKLTDFFVNEFSVARGTLLEGVYNPAHRDVHFVLEVPHMTLGEMQWNGFYMSASVEDTAFIVESGSVAFKVNKNLTFDNPTLLARARGDSVGMEIRWNNWDSILYRGSLSSKIFFKEKTNKIVPLMEIFSSPGQIIIANDVWELTHRGITIDSTSVSIDHLRLLRDNHEISISGVASQSEDDRLKIDVKDFDLSFINTSMQFEQILFGGVANGTASLSNLFDVPVFVSDIRVDDFSLNDSQFGNSSFTAIWNSLNRSVEIEAESILDGWRSMHILGDYYITDQSLNFDIFIDKIPVSLLQPYLETIFTGMTGSLSGDIKLSGAINNPLMNGTIEMNSIALTLDYTRTRYSFAGLATVENNMIVLSGIELFDRFNNMGRVADGYIAINQLKNIDFDIQLYANNLEVLNTRERDNNQFFGQAFATGVVRISGNPHDVMLDVVARTERNTQFNLPLTSSSEISKNTFISFVDHSRQPHGRTGVGLPGRRNIIPSQNEPDAESRFAANLNIIMTPDAEVQLIFDARIGDIIRSRGNGNLILNITDSRFDMRGTYTVDEGDYLFTLQNLFSNKFFVIEKGGIITWSGDPLGALLNIKAIYMARPSLYNLVQDENFRRSAPVECILHISNIMTNPNIRFEIDMPNAGQEVRSFLSAATNSEEEMTRQFLSLLVFNRFYIDSSQTSDGTSGSGFEMGLAGASEFLTGQLSYMFSQMSNIDFDFRIRSGDFETGGQNYEFDIGGEWWNFHANYETAENIGEFSLEIRLPGRNKLRFKAFNRANSYISQNTHTQGVGLLFREEFNQMKELLNRKKPVATRREEELNMSDDERVSDSEGARLQKNVL